MGAGRLQSNGHVISFFTRNLARLAPAVLSMLEEHGQVVEPNLRRLADAFNTVAEKIRAEAVSAALRGEAKETPKGTDSGPKLEKSGMDIERRVKKSRRGISQSLDDWDAGLDLDAIDSGPDLDEAGLDFGAEDLAEGLQALRKEMMLHKKHEKVKTSGDKCAFGGQCLRCLIHTAFGSWSLALLQKPSMLTLQKSGVAAARSIVSWYQSCRLCSSFGLNPFLNTEARLDQLQHERVRLFCRSSDTIMCCW
jgi:hypothetical protein